MGDSRSRGASARTCAGSAGEPASPRKSWPLRASLHRTEIGLLERGERMPRIDTAIKLAGALGLPLASLVEGIDWTTR